MNQCIAINISISIKVFMIWLHPAAVFCLRVWSKLDFLRVFKSSCAGAMGAVVMLGHIISLVIYFLMAKPERSVSDASPADAGWILGILDLRRLWIWEKRCGAVIGNPAKIWIIDGFEGTYNWMFQKNFQIKNHHFLMSLFTKINCSIHLHPLALLHHHW